MKTKMIFTIAALLMLGSVCLNAQGSGEGATPTDYSKQPFTIVAHNEDVTISMVATTSEVFEDVKFSTDKGQTWTFFFNTDVFYKVIPANTTLSLRGFFLTYLYSFEISGGTFDVEGNIASLSASSYETKWETKTVVGGLKSLFSGHTNLVSAENLVLPATTLLESCYKNMFKGCTSLTKAPELPATTLAKGCYASMFSGCTSLNYIKCLATDISATDCTDGWLDGVSSSGTFVKAASMNNWSTGASGIPSGWTVINDGAASTDYSKQPFTIVPLEKDMTVWFLGERDDHVTESINVFYSYDGGETWIEKGFGDWRQVTVNLGQKVSLRVNNCSSAWGIKNTNSEDNILGRFNVEGVLESMSPCDGYKGYFKGMTTLVSAENLIIPEDTYCEEMFAGCKNLKKALVDNMRCYGRTDNCKCRKNYSFE